MNVFSKYAINSLILILCLTPNLALGQTPEEVRLTHDLNQWKQKNHEKIKEFDSVQLYHDGLCDWLDKYDKNGQSNTQSDLVKRGKYIADFRKKHINPNEAELQRVKNEYKDSLEFFRHKYARVDLDRRYAIFTKPYSQINPSEIDDIEMTLDSYIELDFYDEYRAKFDEFNRYYKIYLGANNALNQPYDSAHIEGYRTHTKSIYYRHRDGDPTLTISEEQFKEIDNIDISLSRYVNGYKELVKIVKAINNNTKLAQARKDGNEQECRSIISSIVERNPSNEAIFAKYFDKIAYLKNMHAMYLEELSNNPFAETTKAEEYILNCSDPAVERNIEHLKQQIESEENDFNKKCADLHDLEKKRTDLNAKFVKESYLQERVTKMMTIWHDEKYQQQERISVIDQLKNTNAELVELCEIIAICREEMTKASLDVQAKYEGELYHLFSEIDNTKLESIKQECLHYSGHANIEEFIGRIDVAKSYKELYVKSVAQLNAKFDKENVTSCIESIGEIIPQITDSQRPEFEEILAKLEKFEQGVKVLNEYFTSVNADRNNNSYYDTFQFEIRNRNLMNLYRERIDTYVMDVPYLKKGYEDFLKNMKQNAQYHPEFEKEILSYTTATE